MNKVCGVFLPFLSPKMNGPQRTACLAKGYTYSYIGNIQYPISRFVRARASPVNSQPGPGGARAYPVRAPGCICTGSSGQSGLARGPRSNPVAILVKSRSLPRPQSLVMTPIPTIYTLELETS